MNKRQIAEVLQAQVEAIEVERDRLTAKLAEARNLMNEAAGEFERVLDAGSMTAGAVHPNVLIAWIEQTQRARALLSKLKKD